MMDVRRPLFLNAEEDDNVDVDRLAFVTASLFSNIAARNEIIEAKLQDTDNAVVHLVQAGNAWVERYQNDLSHLWQLSSEKIGEVLTGVESNRSSINDLYTACHGQFSHHDSRLRTMEEAVKEWGSDMSSRLLVHLEEQNKKEQAQHSNTHAIASQIAKQNLQMEKLAKKADLATSSHNALATHTAAQDAIIRRLEEKVHELEAARNPASAAQSAVKAIVPQMSMDVSNHVVTSMSESYNVWLKDKDSQVEAIAKKACLNLRQSLKEELDAVKKSRADWETLLKSTPRAEDIQQMVSSAVEASTTALMKVVKESLANVSAPTSPSDDVAFVSQLVDAKVDAALAKRDSAKREVSPTPQQHTPPLHSAAAPFRDASMSPLSNLQQGSPERASVLTLYPDVKSKQAEVAASSGWISTNLDTVQVFPEPSVVASLDHPYNFPYTKGNTQPALMAMISQIARRVQLYKTNPNLIARDSLLLTTKSILVNNKSAKTQESLTSVDPQFVAEWTIVAGDKSWNTPASINEIQKTIRLLHRARQLTDTLTWKEFEEQSASGEYRDKFGDRASFPVMTLNL